jgi:uncharacterized protein (UPF0261 family)
MCEGAREVVLALWREGRLDGALCLGGAEGALLGAGAMHGLPVGVPKLIVSPSASGRRAFGPFMGETDTCVMHSVIDILGINPISKAVFENAAAAIVGMARAAGGPVGDLGDSTIGITMLGQTTPGVMHLRDRLVAAGLDAVVFHANGVGGPAMERLLEQGALGGVIDYTLSEIANSVKDGVHAVGPERMTVAGRLGIPQVVVPGCVDFFNQNAPETLPAEYRSRRTYFHNRVATLVGTTPEEMREIAATIGERLGGARAPVDLVVPTRGFSLSGVPGEPLWDDDANAAFSRRWSARAPGRDSRARRGRRQRPGVRRPGRRARARALRCAGVPRARRVTRRIELLGCGRIITSCRRPGGRARTPSAAGSGASCRLTPENVPVTLCDVLIHRVPLGIMRRKQQ